MCVNKDDMSDDAEFEAFLKGEGELSRRLQALPQPSPGAELDAAILGRVKQDLAREERPPAANDAGDDVPVPRLGRGLGARWRIPAGIAATVLVGVMAKQSFEANPDARLESVPQETTSADVVIVQKVPEEPAQMLELPAAVAPQARAPVPRQEAKELRRQAPAPTPVLEVAPSPAAPAPAPVAELATAPATAAVAARKSTAAAAQERAENSRIRDFTGSSARSGESWVAEIEKLLQQERGTEALAEWKKFRETYPAYEVSPELEAKIARLVE